MNEMRECASKPVPKEVTVSQNFQALEEAIAEISECENISNEREFFNSYKIKILKLD
ncbi:hypothetical protein [uncultured Methanobrevibacter sp.]|uniref:hypothetical protein n=1 Tax=uncultured Methanobrevibacter sp. TaxID=253161 RepID=UPI0025E1C6D2|nr:hypothetical protein [uncultured Methanobrevibacter sp.]